MLMADSGLTKRGVGRGEQRNKVTSLEDAVALIHSGDTICTSGFVGIGTPDGAAGRAGARFLETARAPQPDPLFAAGQGDGKGQGLDRLGHDGLLQRVVGGHWGLIPSVGKLALENRIEAYNLPQGCISHLYRDIAAGKPGLSARSGWHLRRPAPGRRQGQRGDHGGPGPAASRSTAQEWLLYRTFPIQMALIRGTTADPAGNISMEREALTLDNLAMAMAAKNSGGLVIVQVERIAEVQQPAGARRSGFRASWSTPWWWPIRSGTGRPTPRSTHRPSPTSSASRWRASPPMPLDARKIIARRAAMELPANGVVNLGIGMPEGVASVANEEKILALHHA